MVIVVDFVNKMVIANFPSDANVGDIMVYVSLSTASTLKRSLPAPIPFVWKKEVR